jgi:hypothetical protein
VRVVRARSHCIGKVQARDEGIAGKNRSRAVQKRNKARIRICKAGEQVMVCKFDHRLKTSAIDETVSCKQEGKRKSRKRDMKILHSIALVDCARSREERGDGLCVWLLKGVMGELAGDGGWHTHNPAPLFLPAGSMSDRARTEDLETEEQEDAGDVYKSSGHDQEEMVARAEAELAASEADEAYSMHDLATEMTEIGADTAASNSSSSSSSSSSSCSPSSGLRDGTIPRGTADISFIDGQWEMKDSKAKKERRVWYSIDGTSFKTRQGPDYAKHKRKAPSEEPLYECQMVRLYSSPRKIFNMGGKLALPEAAANCTGLALPGCIILTWLLPAYAPSLLKSKTDGEGQIKIMYFVLTPKTQHLLRTTHPDQFPPAIKLLLNYINDAPTPKVPKGAASQTL